MVNAAASSSGLPSDRHPKPPDHHDSPHDFDEVWPNEVQTQAVEPSIARFHDKGIIKEVIKSNNKDIRFEVKLWVEKYKKDPKPAIADLLTMFFENFKAAFDLPKAGYFGPEDKESLRSCVQAINFCTTANKGELQGFVLDKLKEPEDELPCNLELALKEAMEGVDNHLLIVNLKQLYEVQLLKSVPIEHLFSEFSNAVEKFRSTNDEVVSLLLLNMYLHVSWSLHSIVNSEDPSVTSLSSLCSKRDTLLEHLGYFLDSSQCEGEVKVGNQLAFKVCLILVDLWYLFRKENFSSKKFENLGFSPDQSASKLFRPICEQQLNISSISFGKSMSLETGDCYKCSDFCGTTVIGIHYDGGYVLGADTRSSNEVSLENDPNKELKIRDSRDKFHKISDRIMGVMAGNALVSLEMKRELIAKCAHLDFDDVVKCVKAYFERHRDCEFATIICGSKPGSPCKLFGIKVDQNQIKPYEEITFCTFGSGDKHVLSLADKMEKKRSY